MQFNFLDFYISNFLTGIPALIASIAFIFYLCDYHIINRKLIILAIVFAFLDPFITTSLTVLGPDRVITFTSHFTILIAQYVSAITFYFIIFKKINLYILNCITITSFILLSVSESSIIFIYNGLYQVPLTGIQLHLLLYGIMYPIVAFFAYKILKGINLRKLFRQFFTNKILTIFLTITLLLLTHSQLILNEILSEETILNFTHVIFASQFFIMSIIFFSIAFYQGSKEKLVYQNELIKEQDNYLSTLVQLQKDMRLFQHDYKNMLSALYLLAETKDSVKIKEYIDTSIINIDSRLVNKIDLTANLSTIKITELKNHILSKIELLDKQSITLNIKVLTTVSDYCLNTSQLLNEFKESFDYLIKTTPLNKTINISINVVNNNLILKLSNNISSKTIEHPYLENINHSNNFVFSNNKVSI